MSAEAKLKNVPRFAAQAAASYGARLHRFLARRLRQNRDAEDLAQEVYMRLLYVEQADLIQNPQAYIFKVAGQVVGEFHKRAQVTQEHLTYDTETVERLADQVPDETTDDLAQRLCTQDQLRRALAELAPMHRMVLLLKKYEGHSYKEIARRLSLSERTVERYLADAKEQLKTLLWDRER
jgi:RNA polymerase sigma-19 factor, ECF subfamily